ncbi:MAG TPA: hypothetical protein VGO58_16665, partial [Chitinophagaceae bacterium]|nr:hypothetical protein [Chitinophagaceae bacterium]
YLHPIFNLKSYLSWLSLGLLVVVFRFGFTPLVTPWIFAVLSPVKSMANNAPGTQVISTDPKANLKST